jgi:hypothetical protein
MAIPMVPFEGRMSYCLIKSLQMVLAHKGYEYPLPWLECVSGQPFGFVYLRDGKQFFALNGYEYHLAGEHLLRTLNFTYSYTGSANDQEALDALRQALQDGPVALGMLDMGYLTYSPNHRYAMGSDHAIVVLALNDDHLIVHDPDGFVAVKLPLTDFLESWRRDVYTGKPYGLWKIGTQNTPPTTEEIWQSTLNRARSNFAQTSQTFPDMQVLYGPKAMIALAEDMRTRRDIPIEGLAYFCWRVSNQRCFDSAMFLSERLPDAAAIRWEQSLIFGAIQQATMAGQRDEIADLLERLADNEARFIAEINNAQ